MSIEQISDSAAGNTQKCTSCQPVEEPTHEHGLNVLCHGAWNEPDQEQSEGDDVYVSTAIELVQVSVSYVAEVLMKTHF